MTIRQFNARPRPRCLAMGFGAGEFALLEGILPGIRRISSMTDVHQADWDLLICEDEDLRAVAPNLFVIAIGGLIIGPTNEDDGLLIARRDHFDEELEKGIKPVSVAVEFSTPDAVAGRFEPLIADDLVPLLVEGHWHSTLLAYRPTDVAVGEPSLTIPGVERLLVGSDGAVYAAHFKRPGGKSWCLTLPPRVKLLAWVEAAVGHWNSIDAKRFPGTLDWTNQAWEWLTPDEIKAADAVVAALQEKDRVEALRVAAMEAFNAARASSRAGPFRLFTETGKGLADAVRDAFRDIGFVVRDMDEELTDRDALEDLRVSPLDRADWVALAEVKGYTRSQGKAEDLLNLTGRFGQRYRRTEGKEPDAYWYIVNHHFGDDPTARKTVLEGSDRDVDSFAAVGGLAIDTVDLFKLWRDVVRGHIAPEDARALLVGVTGRFTYESVKVDEPAADAG